MKRNQIPEFNPENISLSKYLFFTGKGGVGKTSIASATAVSLADQGKKVLLISTDPASNLQDVFSIQLSNKGQAIKDVPNLTVLNLNPEEAAKDYRESILAPYRGTVPEAILNNMEEQLSGSCTVEIAAFNEFSEIITSSEKAAEFDYILFDTAPTGHTLRMLELPSAWNNYFEEGSTTSNAYVGQLSGLGEKQEMYKEAVKKLSDPALTTIVLVTRPDFTPIQEVARSSKELVDLKISNQIVVVNGLLADTGLEDEVTKELVNKQNVALSEIPEELSRLSHFYVPLRSYGLTGVAHLRSFFKEDIILDGASSVLAENYHELKELVNHLYATNKRVVFTMGKGGVGKTTMAATIALGLAEKGQKVHLTTTDPADHLSLIVGKSENLTMSSINPEQELQNYKAEVIRKAKDSGMDESQIAYIEEDLRSPCTQEIAVFRAFAEIVNKAETDVVVIDTAPTGHTLLLLDATQSYHKDVERTQGDIPVSVQRLLPKLRNEDETEVIIVTLAETTPVLEAERLKADLERAGISNKWWIVNNSMSITPTSNHLLMAKASSEHQWISKVNEISDGNTVLVPWYNQVLKGDHLKMLLK